MDQILLFASQNRDYSSLLPEKTQLLIRKNKNLITTLTTFTPNSNVELKTIKAQWKQFRRTQKTLNKYVPEELMGCLFENSDVERLYAKNVEKYTNRNAHVNSIINKLSSFNPHNKQECAIAKTLYEEYKSYHKNETDLPRLSLDTKVEDKKLRQLNRKRAIVLLSESCQCCGFPVTKTLDVHHIKPVSTWVTGDPHVIENEMVACPNCHRFIHHALTYGHIPKEIKNYLGPYPEIIEKIEMYVKMGISEIHLEKEHCIKAAKEVSTWQKIS